MNALEHHRNAHLGTSGRKSYCHELCPVLPAPGTRFLSVAVCGCSAVGTLPGGCDSDGKCFCRPEFTGPRCEQCSPGYHSYPHCYGKGINLQPPAEKHAYFCKIWCFSKSKPSWFRLNLADLFWRSWIMPKPGRQSSFYQSRFLITTLL